MKNFITKVLTIMVMLLATICHCYADDISVTRLYNPDMMMLQTLTDSEGSEYTAVTHSDLTPNEQIGQPDLPIDYFQVTLPTYCKDIRVKIDIIDTSDTVVLKAPVLNVRDMSEKHTYIHSKVETSLPDNSGVYPISCFISNQGYLFGNIHTLSIGVSPIAYNAKTLEMFMAKQIVAHVEYTLCSEADVLDKPVNSNGENNIFRNIIESMVASKSHPASKSSASSYGNALKYSDYYYIIVPEALASGVEKLAVWKRQKGYQVVIKTVESIYKTPKYSIGQNFDYGGNTQCIVDEAASLRAYLRDEFEKNGTFFCLLVGDYRTSMPIRRIQSITSRNYTYHKNPGSEVLIPTDNYFSDLTTDWILEKPEGYSVYFSKSSAGCNYNPDIITGRLLCHTIQEISNYVEKLIIYESNPGQGSPDYLERALYFEQDRIRYHYPETQSGRYHEGLLGESDRVRKKFDPFGDINTIVLQDSCHFIKEDFVDTTRAMPISKPHKGADVIHNMSNVGFISSHGHGSPTTIGTCGDSYYIVSSSKYDKSMLDIRIKDDDLKCGINDMTNFNKPSVMYSVSCDVAPFDVYSYGGDRVHDSSGKRIDILDNGHRFDMPYNMASAYTVAGLYGGVAFLGNTRAGWRGSSADMEANFGELLLNHRIVGLAEALSKTHSKNEYVQPGHTLIGDPEFCMWLQKPMTFQECIMSDFFIGFPNLPSGTKCTTFSFRDNPITTTPLSNSWKMPYLENDFVVSVWHPDYYPRIYYFAMVGGTFVSDHSAIVNYARIGSGTMSKPFRLHMKSTLQLEVIGNVDIYKGFIISGASTANIDAEGICNVHGMTITSKSSLSIKAQQIRIGADFSVAKGTTCKLITK